MAEFVESLPKKRDNKVRNRFYYVKNRVHVLNKNSKYRSEHKEMYKKHSRIHYEKYRDVLVTLLGTKCSKCGFNDVRALQIDHINGDGAKERKIHRGGLLYKSMLLLFSSNPEEFAKKYQLLCANCNWIKKSEQKEHRKL